MKLQAYFQLKSRTKTVLYFCKLFNFFSVKQQNTSFQNEKQLLRQRLHSRMRITSKTVHDINKIKDKFALRFIKSPGLHYQQTENVIDLCNICLSDQWPFKSI